MRADVTYRERLWPRWWAWLLALLLPAMLAVAYGFALGAAVGWVVGALAATVVLAAVAVSAPRVEVSADGLRVGRALLPPAAVGAIEAVDARRIAALRGPGADARTFTALRPWTCRDGVLVTIADPLDPHPAWLVSSRHPDQVTAAVTATIAR